MGFEDIVSQIGPKCNRLCLVLGGSGFIGHWLCLDLKRSETAFVVNVDHNTVNKDYTNYSDFYFNIDLRNPGKVEYLFNSVYSTLLVHKKLVLEVYQLAADMGGAEFVFTGKNDFDILHNNVLINTNVARQISRRPLAMIARTKVLYASSACVYPYSNQTNAKSVNCKEGSEYPANPDSDYGWEKLFSERVWQAAQRNYKVDVRIARFHNVFGPECDYQSSRAKSPAALAYKVANPGVGYNKVVVLGDGTQLRSFISIREALRAIEVLMFRNSNAPLNIGSEYMLSINELVQIFQDFRLARDPSAVPKPIEYNKMTNAIGVAARVSNNTLIETVTGWAPASTRNVLIADLEKMYDWIANQINLNKP